MKGIEARSGLGAQAKLASAEMNSAAADLEAAKTEAVEIERREGAAALACPACKKQRKARRRAKGGGLRRSCAALAHQTT